MPTEKEKIDSWLDDLTNLIRKKREENLALKKVQESLNPNGQSKDNPGPGESDEDTILPFDEADASDMT
jgi:hypothetical protein